MTKNLIVEEYIADVVKKRHLPNSGYTLEPMSGDGSDRMFVRIRLADKKNLIAVVPPQSRDTAMGEAISAWKIGRHLEERGVAVPHIHYFDQATGLIIFEDLGDTHLQELVKHKGVTNPEVIELYRQVVGELARLQIHGVKGFDSSWCWDSPIYDLSLMLQKESGYFLDALCKNYLGFEDFPVELDEEFRFIAAKAACQPAVYLMHRDFQSRNIIVIDNAVKIIDFQGARLGPLGYDLASLVIDPYAAIDRQTAAELIEHYLTAIEKEIEVERDFFMEGYYYLFLQRNLQILGAFAFLSKVRGKDFFRPYLQPALKTLGGHLEKSHGQNLPQLKKLTDMIMTKMKHITEEF